MADENHGGAEPPAYVPGADIEVKPGPNWMDQTSATITEIGMQAQAAGTQAGGGGFSYTPEQLNTIADKWLELKAEYEYDLHLAARIAQVEGPGAEYASGDNARLTCGSGNELVNALRGRVTYCTAQAEKFRTAAGKYAVREEQSEAEINAQKGSL